MIQKLKEKFKFHTVVRLIPAAIFLVFMIGMMIPTIQDETVMNTIKETDISFHGFSSLSDKFEDILQENFHDKTEYVNLNGLTARILGINSLNERQKLQNGYLAQFEGEKDVEYASSEVIELNKFLNDRDIEFLYILLPTQASYYNVKFAPGYEDSSSQNISTMIHLLDEAGVPNFNMNIWFYENEWSMEDALFKTDQHWRPEASFETAKLTMEYFSNLGVVKYDPETLNEDNWTITTLKDWFLGSHGQRTGALYAGVDDFSVYIPNYQTSYLYSYLNYDSTDWTYLDSPLNLSLMEGEDHLTYYMNAIYLYGNYPIRKIENIKANCDKKILILGDSNRRSYEYFLSTQFKEVYGIDTRYYKDGTVAQYIEEMNPDIVIMCSYENSLEVNSLYTFGTSNYLNALNSTIGDSSPLISKDFTVSSGMDNQNTFTVVYTDLEPEQTYTLTVDSTSYSGDESEYIQMSLYDISTNEDIYNRYFNANSNETQKWIFSVPESENSTDVYAIYLYAGTDGQTENATAKVNEVILKKGLYED